MNAPAERWGGPFDGRVDNLGEVAVYRAPKCPELMSLGIPFRPALIVGRYAYEVGNSSRLIWHEARQEAA